MRERRIVEIKDMRTLKRSFPSRRNIYLATFIIAVLLFFAGYYILSLGSDSRDVLASLEDLEGMVEVLPAGGSESIAAEEGLLLLEGDKLITGSDGHASIAFSDGSYTRVAPGSDVLMSSLFKVEDDSSVVVMQLFTGRLWNRVVDLKKHKSRFEINTPSSVVGVLGTQFFIEVGENKDAVARVYEGALGIFAASEDDGMAFSPQEGELILDTVSQVDLFYKEPLPIYYEPVNVLAVDDFEKDCLAEDNPLIYVEIDLEASEILYSLTKDRLNGVLAELELLYREIDFMKAKLSESLDSVLRKDAEGIIALLQKQVDENLILFELLEVEYDFIKEQREALKRIALAIAGDFSTLGEAELAEEVRNAVSPLRLVANHPAKRERVLGIAAQNTVIEDLHLEVVGGFKALGMDKDLKELRELAKLTLNSYNYPEHTAASLAGSSGEAESAKTESSIVITAPRLPISSGQKEVSSGKGKGDKGVVLPGVSLPDDEMSEPKSEYRVNVNAPYGGGIINGSGIYEEGKEVTISAIPHPGYRFVKWSVDDDIFSNEAEYSFTVNSHLNLEAVFALESYMVLFVDHGNLELHFELVEHGKDANPPGVPEREGYTFIGWDKDLTNVTEDLVVTAFYKINEYELIYSAGPNGSIVGQATQTVYHGENGSEVNAVPVINYHFLGWSDGLNSATRTDLAVTSPLKVVAEFAIDTYDVIFIDQDGTFLKIEEVPHGGNAVPPEEPLWEGYVFIGWDSDYTDVTSDITLNAVYEVSSESSFEKKELRELHTVPIPPDIIKDAYPADSIEGEEDIASSSEEEGGSLPEIKNENDENDFSGNDNPGEIDEEGLNDVEVLINDESDESAGNAELNDKLGTPESDFQDNSFTDNVQDTVVVNEVEDSGTEVIFAGEDLDSQSANCELMME